MVCAPSVSSASGAFPLHGVRCQRKRRVRSSGWPANGLAGVVHPVSPTAWLSSSGFGAEPSAGRVQGGGMEDVAGGFRGLCG